jgi:putative transposase
MARKNLKPEEIATKLRQVEMLVGQGMARVDAIREALITEQTYYLYELIRVACFQHLSGVIR